MQARPGSRRDRLAVLVALVTAAGLGSVFFVSTGTSVLMPGPLASAHGAIKTCNTCHTKSGSGKLSWVHGLVPGDPLADSKACLTCHKMPDTAFNAHGASADVLKQSTGRLTKAAARSPVPHSARAQSVAFPTQDVVAGGLVCAACHQEHQGVNFKLNKISNEQCRSCHVVKFDSFDRDHPKFDNYPFKSRTRIVYDHAGHFGKHYPELAKKEPAKAIPATCSTCHNSSDDKRAMAVAPFEQTCATCHLDQIKGNERASGPKGIAFLTLPGLDLQSLKKKNTAIGEWPAASDAALTPFMKVMISRNERGRSLVKTVDSLNLQDLTGASDGQIKAVTDLVWEIKTLVHGLISGKASDVLGDLNIGGGAKLSAALVADLTASIPRDVVASAQQQWLPNLAAEMANRPATGDHERSGWGAVITESGLSAPADSAEPSGADGVAGKTDPANAKIDDRTEKDSAERSSSEPADSRVKESDTSEAKESKPARDTKFDPPPCTMRVLGQCLVFKDQKDEAQEVSPEGAAALTGPADPKADRGKTRRSTDELPGKMNAGVKDARTLAQPDDASGKSDAANSKAGGGETTLAANEQPPSKTTDQADDLLFPTEDELRAIKAAEPNGAATKTDPANIKPDGPGTADAASKAGASAVAPADAAIKPLTNTAPVISIESNVDPESWAEYGGWYRQDYSIFYRPTGHKDKFNYSWLYLTGPLASKGDTSPEAAVFDFLTSKDAQGSCTKCHSVDDIPGKGRAVNFSPASFKTKQGRFTSFIHEPHFGLMEDRGCLTCHKLEKGRVYVKGYEQGNPQSFASNFGAVKKELCQSCHASGMARQDCLTCHKYHVNGVITPIMSTKNPTQ